MMAAVVFADLVGYSKKPITDQMAAKEAFRSLLQDTLEPVAPGSRVVVDTGDGAAVAFLADPEHALYFTLRLCRDIQTVAARGPLRPEDLRLGINLGPVRRAVDVNGRSNLVGEGMNSAERVMSFSIPGEITASRSFCDAVSCLHESYRELFEPLGQRADKHGRQHEVFRVVVSQNALEAAMGSLLPAPGTEPSATTGAMGPAKARRSPAVAMAIVVTGLIAVGIATWYRGGSVASPPASSPAESAGAGTIVERAAPAPVGKANSPSLTVTVEPEGVSGKSHAETGPTALAPLESPAQASREIEASKPPLPAASVGRREMAKAAQGTRPAAGRVPSSRCSLLLQRATLGDRLTAPEQEELRASCS